MATTKTVRLDTDQADWLARMASESGISENRIMGMLIDRARADKLGLAVSFKPADA